MYTCAPLVLFLYNRPDHTCNLFSALSKLTLVHQTDLFIFCDQSKTGSDAKVEQVRAQADEFAKKNYFKNVQIFKASKNKGLADSIIEGVSEIIQKYGQVIVLEDDLIPSKDFLVYMNDGLRYYENCEEIWALSGYTFPLKSFKNYHFDIYTTERGCSWGWATWRNRWESVDWQVSDYEQFKHEKRARRKFSAWGRDLPLMLDQYMQGKNHSWAIRWCYSAFKQGKKTIYPVESRIINNGDDGSGTNVKHSEKRFMTTLYTGTKRCSFALVPENRSIRREFSNVQMPNAMAFKIWVWRIVNF